VAIRTALLLACLSMSLVAPPTAATSQVVSLSDYCTPNDGGDDADCMQLWMNQALNSSGKDLYVPPGVWHFSKAVTPLSNVRIRCAGPKTSIFRRMDGTEPDFLVTTANLENLLVENCGFDFNGGTTRAFAAMIGVNPSSNASPLARNIQIRGNRIYDSKWTGTPGKVRDAILLINCEDCWIEGNYLSDGARMKIGRPGNRLLISRNVVHNGNDSAIAVVDRTAGTSTDLTITDNTILNPVLNGIFFGGDGESANLAATSVSSVLVAGNHVRGDWATACILGTLPAKARGIQVVNNTCTKTGANSGSGIVIKRVVPAPVAAEQVLISGNSIGTEGGRYFHGGIFVSDRHKGLRIVRNDVRNVTSEAIHLRHIEIEDGVVADNMVTGSTLTIDGTFRGSVTGNLVAGAQASGMRFATTAGQQITASVTGNTVWSAKTACIVFEAAGNYQVDLVGNTLRGCGTVAVAGQPSAASMRLHNRGDVAPHATPIRHLSGRDKWVTASIPPGGKEGVNVKVPGAAVGDIANASFDALTAEDWQISSYVVGPNVVRVVVTNRTGASHTLSGMVRVQVWKF
jgi:hypothetical protein